MIKGTQDRFDKGQKVSIVICRLQDGESALERHTGLVREINGSSYLSFCETQPDGLTITHFLKIYHDRLEWVRCQNGVKSSVVFEAGKSVPFLFDSGCGYLDMTISTHSYIFEKAEKKEINICYSITQNDIKISEYETTITFTGDP